MPSRPPIAPRRAAELELETILAEIPLWDDAMLCHMHKRYGTSRLFRVRHDPQGEMTERAKMLQLAAKAEMDVRGLSPLAESDPE